MGLQKANGLRRIDKPGRNMLHELTATNTVLHERTSQSGLPNAHRERRPVQERAVRASASLL